MTDFDRPSFTIEEQDRRRPGSRPRLGDRLARTFGGFDRTREEMPAWEVSEDLGYPAEDDSTAAWDVTQTRFPLARKGYEPSVVDEHVASLERELEETRTRTSGAVSAEIEKIGEQTSAILLVAHDKAREITRSAQEQADRCVADAASNAVALTEGAKQRVRQLDAEAESIWEERARLLDDARTVATALAALIDKAAARFPADAERGTVAIPTITERRVVDATSIPAPDRAEEPVGAPEAVDVDDLELSDESRDERPGAARDWTG
jgi:cell division septum initiation protein DivIVA